MEDIGKAETPPSGHTAAVIHEGKGRVRIKPVMFREISLEVPICEDVMRAVIKEEPEELDEIDLYVSHKRYHVLDITWPVEIVVVEMRDDLSFSGIA